MDLLFKDYIDNDKFEEAKNSIDLCYKNGSNIGVTVSVYYHNMHLIEYAVYKRNFRIFEYLTKYTDINEPNYNGASLLYHVIYMWGLGMTSDILNVLLRYSLNIDAKYGTHESALY